MTDRSRTWFVASLLALAVAPGCAAIDEVPPDGDDELASHAAAISPAQRRARAAVIRDAAAARGLHNGLLLAGIANAETQMAHCWSELTWACKGPASKDCGGGPMVAGSGDGPCSYKQGGLGMFQFDAGTHAQTLAREGKRILTVAGSVDAAIDFVVDMVKRSEHIAGVTTDAEAIAWMNDVHVGTKDYGRWIRTVTHYYNGCDPDYCGVYSSRYDHYDQATRDLVDELGAAFWESVPRMGVTWERLDDGTYAFAAWGQPKAVRVRYAIDGKVVGNAAKDDPDTDEVEASYPWHSPLLAEKPGRLVEVTGYDASDRAVGRAVAQLEVTEATAVYIRQIDEREYEVGLERAPAEVATVRVSVDDYVLTDSVSGDVKSGRLAVRHAYNILGTRDFAVTTYGADGKARGTLHRTFTLE